MALSCCDMLEVVPKFHTALRSCCQKQVRRKRQGVGLLLCSLVGDCGLRIWIHQAYTGSFYQEMHQDEITQSYMQLPTVRREVKVVNKQVHWVSEGEKWKRRSEWWRH